MKTHLRKSRIMLALIASLQPATAQYWQITGNSGTTPDDKSISTLEFDGVELAAIQGLNQKLDQTTDDLQAQLLARDKRVAELEKALATLKELVGKLASQGTSK